MSAEGWKGHFFRNLTSKGYLRWVLVRFLAAYFRGQPLRRSFSYMDNGLLAMSSAKPKPPAPFPCCIWATVRERRRRKHPIVLIMWVFSARGGHHPPTRPNRGHRSFKIKNKVTSAFSESTMVRAIYLDKQIPSIDISPWQIYGLHDLDRLSRRQHLQGGERHFQKETPSARCKCDLEIHVGRHDKHALHYRQNHSFLPGFQLV